MASFKQLTDATIGSLIREFVEQGKAVTGVSVRKELRLRFGKPGGVSRIYRLIQTTVPRGQSITQPTVNDSEQSLIDEIAQLKKLLAEANAARDYAERQEAYWIMQVDAMRQRLANQEQSPRFSGGAQFKNFGLQSRLETASGELVEPADPSTDTTAYE